MNRRMEKKKQKLECPATPATPSTQTTSCAALYIQYHEQEYSASAIEKEIREKCLSEGAEASALKDLSIYIKPEDKKAYYACGDKTGFIEL